MGLFNLLKEQVRLLQHKLFGEKSEKLSGKVGTGQLLLFNEAEQVENQETTSKKEQIEVPAHTRKRGKRKSLPDNLPRIDVIHDLTEEEKQGCRIEQSARDQQLSYDQVKQLWQKKAKPILDEFGKGLEEQVLKTPPSGLLGKAISYALGQWNRLTVYIEDGRLHLDNNLAENAIRPFVVGRKNWLFSATPAGAHASAMLYNLVETAKANGLEPYWYLRYFFERLPTAKTKKDQKALLPQYADRTKIGSAS